MRFLLLLFILPSPLFAADIYGPMPSLQQLAPQQTPSAVQPQVNLNYDGWYQRLGRDVKNKKALEWNVRPNQEVTKRLKNGAVNGGLNISKELKNMDPTQVEGELIIRY